jgi:hypothetical protein
MKGEASIPFGWPETADELNHDGKGTRTNEPQKQEAPWQSVFRQKCAVSHMVWQFGVCVSGRVPPVENRIASSVLGFASCLAGSD